MIKAIASLCLLTALCLSAPARADDAQRRVDAAKTAICEKEKLFLAEREAKGRCVAEASESRRIACSASTEPLVRELQNRCIAPSTPHCRALDPADHAIVYAEASDSLATRCVRYLMDNLRSSTHCRAHRGDTIAYTTSYDHTIGSRRLSDHASTLTCPR